MQNMKQWKKSLKEFDMCIPHGMSVPKDSGFVKKERPKKHLQRVSQDVFEKGDPTFVDERIQKDEPKVEEGFLSSLFSKS